MCECNDCVNYGLIVNVSEGGYEGDRKMVHTDNVVMS